MHFVFKKSLPLGYFVWVSCLVYTYISIENDSNLNTQRSQRKAEIEKVSNDKPFIRSKLVKYKSHNTNWIPKQLIEPTYVITRNIKITLPKLVSILLRFYAVSSRLLLNTWHSNDPEQNVHIPVEVEAAFESCLLSTRHSIFFQQWRVHNFLLNIFVIENDVPVGAWETLLLKQSSAHTQDLLPCATGMTLAWAPTNEILSRMRKFRPRLLP